MPGKFLHIKPYTLTELAAYYGLSCRIMTQWLAPFKEEIGKKIGRIYNIKQVEIIFKRLGTVRFIPLDD